ncbi:DNA repair protein RecO [Cellvibrio japonicus]|uniref:DNA repair protein RecO n=1 Tax=Cellvibrio japonicus (strain Ueda107) TaxID=498211 RepID=RECO_CELJU|nr:DNA repair protein RecO [Cellvibrio japonicus]B3PL65.1 RecName: Full=DNA repair protein RecO; AltName: Full=Recombination protein O [Cellvibrio japonicus Ueda107]ACE84292.1 DNA repair protein RecO [Cellvibrio japonicus Ueda107]QEI12952.1 DNA repair protein RecO [Cellvibrio japonicus]QEI16526.1 DNA repair protein RecO [Cellvibrio japonicus]QEI20104.1 DNA repair protein RecO [Cellvibrio japonicus]
MRVDLQPAYILHARPYRDTSLLLDLLTPVYGRITAVARGVRQSKGHKRQLLNPFHRLLVNWQGKSELKLITGVETDHHYLQLQGNALYSGFYLNELLVRLLPEQDVITGLFERYEWTLDALHRGEPLEPLLREFEFMLLQGLGYALDFLHDCHSQQPIQSGYFYLCDIHQGFYSVPADSDPRFWIAGAHLLAIAAGDYSAADTRRVAKQLARLLFKPLLGKRPLKSRELFTPGSPH